MPKVKRLLVVISLFFFCFTFVWASGTSANFLIEAPSVNLQVSYPDGSGGTQTDTGQDFSIKDATQNVLEINGLFEHATDLSALGTLSSGIYRGLNPGTDYQISFTYRNRGNADTSVNFTVTETDPLTHWTYPKS